jgi:hypothetical protein
VVTAGEGQESRPSEAAIPAGLTVRTTGSGHGEGPFRAVIRTRVEIAVVAAPVRVERAMLAALVVAAIAAVLLHVLAGIDPVLAVVGTVFCALMAAVASLVPRGPERGSSRLVLADRTIGYAGLRRLRLRDVRAVRLEERRHHDGTLHAVRADTASGGVDLFLTADPAHARYIHALVTEAHLRDRRSG